MRKTCRTTSADPRHNVASPRTCAVRVDVCVSSSVECDATPETLRSVSRPSASNWMATRAREAVCWFCRAEKLQFGGLGGEGRAKKSVRGWFCGGRETRWICIRKLALFSPFSPVVQWLLRFLYSRRGSKKCVHPFSFFFLICSLPVLFLVSPSPRIVVFDCCREAVLFFFTFVLGIQFGDARISSS